jgi:hypothetical protein
MKIKFWLQVLEKVNLNYKVLLNYLKTWFIIDFISSMPLNYIIDFIP